MIERSYAVFYQRSLAAKIAVYIGVLLILACGGLVSYLTDIVLQQ